MTEAEEREFTWFVQDRGAHLARYARLVMADPADAEDALQQALLQLVRHWTRASASPEGYVRTCILNLAKVSTASEN